MFRSAVLICLLLACSSVRATEDDPHPVRMGDLQVTVTAVGAVSPKLAASLWTRPQSGYHFVVVSVRVKNLAAYRSCTEFDPVLTADSGQDHYSPFLDTGLAWPETFNLTPFQENEGNYVFQVRDGTKPVALNLIRHINTEDLYAMVQKRPVMAPEQREVKIDLEAHPSSNGSSAGRETTSDSA